jgi:hypothetical protein
MVDPGGNNLTGPYITNGDSTATNKTYTLLSPGTNGGLITGSYQSEPSPGFDSSGNSLSARIIQPTKFFNVEFGVSTNAVDPQTNSSAPAPSVSFNSADQLSGNLSAWAASWNKQEFNQGAPKPGGAVPGNTMGSPVGSYNPVTGAFTLIWASQIVGGPFNNFTGVWHLQGTFVSTDGTVGSVVTSTSSTGDPANGDSLAFTGMSPWPLRIGVTFVILGTLLLVIDRRLRMRGLVGFDGEDAPTTR